jgi:hypothetical protein
MLRLFYDGKLLCLLCQLPLQPSNFRRLSAFYIRLARILFGFSTPAIELGVL